MLGAVRVQQRPGQGGQPTSAATGGVAAEAALAEEGRAAGAATAVAGSGRHEEAGDGLTIPSSGALDKMLEEEMGPASEEPAEPTLLQVLQPALPSQQVRGREPSSKEGCTLQRQR